jgi:hypothetical protein
VRRFAPNNQRILLIRSVVEARSGGGNSKIKAWWNTIALNILLAIPLFLEFNKVEKHKACFIVNIIFDKKFKTIFLIELVSMGFVVSINDDKAAACFISFGKPYFYKIQQGSADTLSLQALAGSKTPNFDGGKT